MTETMMFWLCLFATQVLVCLMYLRLRDRCEKLRLDVCVLEKVVEALHSANRTDIVELW